MNKINVGIIGLAARGTGLLCGTCASSQAKVVAVCDIYEDRIQRAIDLVKEKTGVVSKGYKNYIDLIQDKNVDAVIIATPWHTHTEIAIASMKAGKFTASEVYGAYDIEECWQLVRTYEETKTPFMMLENCCFDRFELLTTSLARAGKFGKIVYCHGAYAHELRQAVMNGEDRHYRTLEYIARNCENYPTHELGPIAKLLNVNRGNKLLSLTSVSTRPGVSIEKCIKDGYCKDPALNDVKYNQGDIITTTITTVNGEVITLRLDTTLPRFYDREFTVRGTNGLAMQTQNLVMIEGETNLEEHWNPNETIQSQLNSANNYEEYLPDFWRNITEEERKLGHGGMDYFELQVFFNAILNGTEMPIDVYDAATWMSITPLSEQSIAHGGMPQAIPDFTRGQWIRREPKDVVTLPNPKNNESNHTPHFSTYRK